MYCPFQSFPYYLLLLFFLCVGCSPSPRTSEIVDAHNSSLDLEASATDVGQSKDDSNSGEEGKLPGACADIYSQDFIPVFEIEIDEGPWEQLVEWYKLGPEAIEPKRYVPLKSFRYGDEVTTDAMIRLRGNPFHWWPDPKMQFNISFKQVDDKGRFHGVRKLNLDVAHNDKTLMHDRLAMSLYRQMGIPAPCVNHAKLIINGEYFGLYVNIEHVDQEFLERNFGPDDEGNLYKCMAQFRMEKKTNEADLDVSDIDNVLREDITAEEMKKLVDVDEALLEWAGEALVPHLDGFFVGGVNYQLYNHPTRGFLFIPWDLDYSFEIGGENSDLITAECGWGLGKPALFRVAMSDPELRAKYLEALEVAATHFDSERMVDDILFYEEQIKDAIESDPNLEYSFEEHREAVADLKQYLHKREEYIYAWLRCVHKELETESTTVGDATFLLVETPCSRDWAKEACQHLGGTLATPQDEAEQAHLTQATLDLEYDDWWIAPSDEEDEGHWTGLDGEELGVTFWVEGEPYEHEWVNCAVMEDYYDGLWAAEYCDYFHPFVCRLDGE